MPAIRIPIAGPDIPMYQRLVEPRLRDALSDTAVVLVVGPRRAGKTTLACTADGKTRTYLTLDDQTVLDAARSDPIAFIRGLDHATIDEVQRAPELLLAIKKSVDEDRRPGRFLLTGSANILTLTKVADSLAGRMETIQLLPLTRTELLGQKTTFLNSLFSAKIPKPQNILLGETLIEAVLAGGFPEALDRANERRRITWGRSYLSSILTRDLRDIADVERLTEIPKFVRFLAEYSGQLVNYSKLGGHIQVSHKTAQRYVGLLEQIFLITTLEPWHSNRIKRIIKTPKLHFLDSGLLAASYGLTAERVRLNRKLLGAPLESFVFSEVTKLMGASDMHLTTYHFRDQEMHEVDIVLERDDGALVGIEVKANATVASNDFSGLRKLAEAAKHRFNFGVVLYDGDVVVPFGPRFAAAPVSCLWS
jgi:predicted AAA+ superfamily ATPase